MIPAASFGLALDGRLFLLIKLVGRSVNAVSESGRCLTGENGLGGYFSRSVSLYTLLYSTALVRLAFLLWFLQWACYRYSVGSTARTTSALYQAFV